METIYTQKFYEINKKNRYVAKELHRIITDLVKPKSIVDVGCSSGIFLDQFKGCRILGIDGYWIKDEQLVIPKKNFRRMDFTKNLYQLNEKFDVALCLETAEHIDEKHAEGFIKFLCGLSDVIIFGAAVPKQIGTHHVNEQWQSYWIKKFKEQGYGYSDCVRSRLQQALPIGIGSEYKQNVLLYARGKKVKLFKNFETPLIDIIVPDYWLERNDPVSVPYWLIIKGILLFPKKLIRYLSRNF